MMQTFMRGLDQDRKKHEKDSKFKEHLESIDDELEKCKQDILMDITKTKFDGLAEEARIDYVKLMSGGQIVDNFKYRPVENSENLKEVAQQLIECKHLV
jgi:replicative DNA helicase